MKKKTEKEKPAHLIARAKSRFEVYTVKEATELMDFLMKAKDGISRTTAKSILSNRLVHVNHVITTQYNFQLQPGMKVQISKEKGKKEFQSRYLKIAYEDAYLLVVDKKEGLLTIGTEKQKEQTAYSLLNEYVKRSGKQHRVFVVNKLDKDTSGLLFLPKTKKQETPCKITGMRLLKNTVSLPYSMVKQKRILVVSVPGRQMARYM